MKGTPLGQGFRTRGKALAGATVAAGALTLGAAHADAAHLEVTNTHANGKGSFAAAMKRAARKEDLDTITFDGRLRGTIKLGKIMKVPTGIRIIGNGFARGRNEGRVVLQGSTTGSLLKLTRGAKHGFEELDLDRVAIEGAFPSDYEASVSVERSILSGHGDVHRTGVGMSYNSRYADSDLTISESTIEGFDQGVAVSSAAARIGRSIIRGNVGRGGVAANAYASVNLVNSTISGNELDTAQGGAGVHGGYYAGVDVYNSTVVGNTVTNPAGYGGGVAYNVEVFESTISGNSAPTGGGVAGGQFEPVDVSNSIVSGNHATAPGGFADCDNGAFRSRGGNVIADPGNCVTRPDDAAGVDPLLGPLKNNGGPTPTMAIGEGSPAIGFAVLKRATKADQRGVKRGKDPDSGAYERRWMSGPDLVSP